MVLAGIDAFLQRVNKEWIDFGTRAIVHPAIGGELGLFLLANYLVHEATFISANLFYYFIHRWGLFPSYKIQPGAYPSNELIWVRTLMLHVCRAL